ncbi:MAG: NADP-dependent oxidoreductase [Steroidobacteraceae bacterium]|nr:NADP-dependent oxidoreductase [Steroidobacteraceae bacterium]
MHRRIVLAKRPVGAPRADDFRLEQQAPFEPKEGEIVVANWILSMDPAIRGFLDDRESYMPPVAIGDTVRGMTLGQVVRSRNPAFQEGDIVRGMAGWEDLSLVGEAMGLEKVTVAAGIPLEHYMGALGPTGLTAWIGLNEIGRIAPGDTVVISAAAGAVGSVAGQIGRLQGCRVIGLAGSPEKTAQLQDLGFHAAINYRAVDDLAGAIREVSPDGVDVYFDNVGGATLETMLPLMNEQGRVVACGMVSDYNDQDHPYAVRTLWQVVVKRLTIRGFLVYDHFDRIAEAQAQLTRWVSSGELVPVNNVRDGLENAPAAFIDLMSGKTIGKTLVRLRQPHGR